MAQAIFDPLKEILNTPTQYDGVWFLYKASVFLFTHNPKRGLDG